jgi:hypothetical protein
LEAVLEAGPAVWGWDEDQCWTLARIAAVVRRWFKVDYTLAGLDLLLHRIGWSVQVPARQVSADIQLDDGGVIAGEDVDAWKGPAGGVPAGRWCAWWRLGGQSAVTSGAAVRAADSSTMALRLA